MKTRIFIFIIMLAMLVGCIDHSISKNDFMIRVDTGYKERTGKDYIQCWVNDSLVFNGLYVNRRMTRYWTTMKIGLEWKSPVSIRADMIV